MRREARAACSPQQPPVLALKHLLMAGSTLRLRLIAVVSAHVVLLEFSNRKFLLLTKSRQRSVLTLHCLQQHQHILKLGLQSSNVLTNRLYTAGRILAGTTELLHGHGVQRLVGDLLRLQCARRCVAHGHRLRRYGQRAVRVAGLQRGVALRAERGHLLRKPLRLRPLLLQLGRQLLHGSVLVHVLLHGHGVQRLVGDLLRLQCARRCVAHGYRLRRYGQRAVRVAGLQRGVALRAERGHLLRKPLRLRPLLLQLGRQLLHGSVLVHVLLHGHGVQRLVGDLLRLQRARRCVAHGHRLRRYGQRAVRVAGLQRGVALRAERGHLLRKPLRRRPLLLQLGRQLLHGSVLVHVLLHGHGVQRPVGDLLRLQRARRCVAHGHRLRRYGQRAVRVAGLQRGVALRAERGHLLRKPLRLRPLLLQLGRQLLHGSVLVHVLLHGHGVQRLVGDLLRLQRARRCVAHGHRLRRYGQRAVRVAGLQRGVALRAERGHLLRKPLRLRPLLLQLGRQLLHGSVLVHVLLHGHGVQRLVGDLLRLQCARRCVAHGHRLRRYGQRAVRVAGLQRGVALRAERGHLLRKPLRRRPLLLQLGRQLLHGSVLVHVLLHGHGVQRLVGDLLRLQRARRCVAHGHRLRRYGQRAVRVAGLQRGVALRAERGHLLRKPLRRRPLLLQLGRQLLHGSVLVHILLHGHGVQRLVGDLLRLQRARRCVAHGHRLRRYGQRAVRVAGLQRGVALRAERGHLLRKPLRLRPLLLQLGRQLLHGSVLVHVLLHGHGVQRLVGDLLRLQCARRCVAHGHRLRRYGQRAVRVAGLQRGVALRAERGHLLRKPLRLRPLLLQLGRQLLHGSVLVHVLLHGHGVQRLVGDLLRLQCARRCVAHGHRLRRYGQRAVRVAGLQRGVALRAERGHLLRKPLRRRPLLLQLGRQLLHGSVLVHVLLHGHGVQRPVGDLLRLQRARRCVAHGHRLRRYGQRAVRVAGLQRGVALRAERGHLLRKPLRLRPLLLQLGRQLLHGSVLVHVLLHGHGVQRLVGDLLRLQRARRCVAHGHRLRRYGQRAVRVAGLQRGVALRAERGHLLRKPLRLRPLLLQLGRQLLHGSVLVHVLLHGHGVQRLVGDLLRLQCARRCVAHGHRLRRYGQRAVRVAGLQRGVALRAERGHLLRKPLRRRPLLLQLGRQLLHGSVLVHVLLHGHGVQRLVGDLLRLQRARRCVAHGHRLRRYGQRAVRVAGLQRGVALRAERGHLLRKPLRLRPLLLQLGRQLLHGSVLVHVLLHGHGVQRLVGDLLRLQRARRCVAHGHRLRRYGQRAVRVAGLQRGVALRAERGHLLRKPLRLRPLLLQLGRQLLHGSVLVHVLLHGHGVQRLVGDLLRLQCARRCVAHGHRLRRYGQRAVRVAGLQRGVALRAERGHLLRKPLRRRPLLLQLGRQLLHGSVLVHVLLHGHGVQRLVGDLLRLQRARRCVAHGHRLRRYGQRAVRVAGLQRGVALRAERGHLLRKPLRRRPLLLQLGRQLLHGSVLVHVLLHGHGVQRLVGDLLRLQCARRCVAHGHRLRRYGQRAVRVAGLQRGVALRAERGHLLRKPLRLRPLLLQLGRQLLHGSVLVHVLLHGHGVQRLVGDLLRLQCARRCVAHGHRLRRYGQRAVRVAGLQRGVALRAERGHLLRKPLRLRPLLLQLGRQLLHGSVLVHVLLHGHGVQRLVGDLLRLQCARRCVAHGHRLRRYGQRAVRVAGLQRGVALRAERGHLLRKPLRRRPLLLQLGRQLLHGSVLVHVLLHGHGVQRLVGDLLRLQRARRCVAHGHRLRRYGQRAVRVAGLQRGVALRAERGHLLRKPLRLRPLLLQLGRQLLHGSVLVHVLLHGHGVQRLVGDLLRLQRARRCVAHGHRLRRYGQRAVRVAGLQRGVALRAERGHLLRKPLRLRPLLLQLGRQLLHGSVLVHVLLHGHGVQRLVGDLLRLQCARRCVAHGHRLRRYGQRAVRVAGLQRGVALRAERGHLLRKPLRRRPLLLQLGRQLLHGSVLVHVLLHGHGVQRLVGDLLRLQRARRCVAHGHRLRRYGQRAVRVAGLQRGVALRAERGHLLRKPLRRRPLLLQLGRQLLHGSVLVHVLLHGHGVQRLVGDLLRLQRARRCVAHGHRLRRYGQRAVRVAGLQRGVALRAERGHLLRKPLRRRPLLLQLGRQLLHGSVLVHVLLHGHGVQRLVGDLLRLQRARRCVAHGHRLRRYGQRAVRVAGLQRGVALRAERGHLLRKPLRRRPLLLQLGRQLLHGSVLVHVLLHGHGVQRLVGDLLRLQARAAASRMGTGFAGTGSVPSASRASSAALRFARNAATSSASLSASALCSSSSAVSCSTAASLSMYSSTVTAYSGSSAICCGSSARAAASRMGTGFAGTGSVPSASRASSAALRFARNAATSSASLSASASAPPARPSAAPRQRPCPCTPPRSRRTAARRRSAAAPVRAPLRRSWAQASPVRAACRPRRGPPARRCASRGTRPPPPQASPPPPSAPPARPSAAPRQRPCPCTPPRSRRTAARRRSAAAPARAPLRRSWAQASPVRAACRPRRGPPARRCASRGTRPPPPQASPPPPSAPPARPSAAPRQRPCPCTPPRSRRTAARRRSAAAPARAPLRRSWAQASPVRAACRPRRGLQRGVALRAERGHLLRKPLRRRPLLLQLGRQLLHGSVLVHILLHGHGVQRLVGDLLRLQRARRCVAHGTGFAGTGSVPSASRASSAALRFARNAATSSASLSASALCSSSSAVSCSTAASLSMYSSTVTAYSGSSAICCGSSARAAASLMGTGFAGTGSVPSASRASSAALRFARNAATSSASLSASALCSSSSAATLATSSSFAVSAS
ncbi:flagellar attachment zone protein, putative [Leishmania tarentolae]|uniref:Flagellar attachment zone protein, putative n=1 Tax=Leishmania tarentolae TaxID=5689 RepID=A0A640KXM7_LEITA|nr:flagellar attachment zone protein, putative [Leishmania tarentolae]